MIAADKATQVLSTKPQLVSNSGKKIVCFRAKYEGRPYREMSENLGIPVSTLMTYFSRDWKEEYEQFAKEETEWRIQAARKAVQNQIYAAARELSFLVFSSNHSVRLNAIKYILDRTVGENFFNMIDETETTVVQSMSVKKRTRQYKQDELL